MPSKSHQSSIQLQNFVIIFFNLYSDRVGSSLRDPYGTGFNIITGNPDFVVARAWALGFPVDVIVTGVASRFSDRARDP